MKKFNRAVLRGRTVFQVRFRGRFVYCEAQHCGRRQYLYDDLQNLRLAKALIAEPPVELWPRVVTRVDVPRDLETMVLAQLREGA